MFIPTLRTNLKSWPISCWCWVVEFIRISFHVDQKILKKKYVQLTKKQAKNKMWINFILNTRSICTETSSFYAQIQTEKFNLSARNSNQTIPFGFELASIPSFYASWIWIAKTLFYAI